MDEMKSRSQSFCTEMVMVQVEPPMGFRLERTKHARHVRRVHASVRNGCQVEGLVLGLTCGGEDAPLIS